MKETTSPMLLEATTSEVAYIKEVLRHFRAKLPDATDEQLQAVAARTLFRMRMWEVIYQFRIRNYGIVDVLDSEFIDA